VSGSALYQYDCYWSQMMLKLRAVTMSTIMPRVVVESIASFATMMRVGVNSFTDKGYFLCFYYLTISCINFQMIRTHRRHSIVVAVTAITIDSYFWFHSWLSFRPPIS
jgi:hypothetical protein